MPNIRGNRITGQFYCPEINIENEDEQTERTEKNTTKIEAKKLNSSFENPKNEDKKRKKKK